MKLNKALFGLVVGLTSLVGGSVYADAGYPTKPITLVVAYGPGGSNDIIARAVAKAMEPILGQPVIVRNQSGAGGVVGTTFVANAPPDGYTVGWGTSSQLVMNAGLYKKLPFNLDTDVSMVGLATKFPLVFVVNSKYSSLKDFVAAAEKSPGKLFFGSGGVGQVSHVMTEIFRNQVGIDIRHVPYRGSAEVLQDLAGGRIDIYLETFTAAAPFVASGKARYVAVGSDKRVPMNPDVPTFAEAGYPQFEPYTWSGVFVPARTPSAIVQKLNGALNAALQSAEFKEASKALGILIIGGASPEAAEQFARSERAKWVPRIRQSGIAAD